MGCQQTQLYSISVVVSHVASFLEFDSQYAMLPEYSTSTPMSSPSSGAATRGTPGDMASAPPPPPLTATPGRLAAASGAEPSAASASVSTTASSSASPNPPEIHDSMLRRGSGNSSMLAGSYWYHVVPSNVSTSLPHAG